MNKKWSDEELQRMLDNGPHANGAEVPPASEQDLAAYKLLFDALKKEPAGGLPYDFSANLLRKIEMEKNPRVADIKFYAWAAILAVAAIGLAWVTLGLINKENASQFGTMVLKYKWIYIFMVGGFLTVQYLDQKLVKEV